LADHDLDFKNILLIHFGQLGDVVLALPAMRAVRERFPDAKITALTGKVSGEVVSLSRFADEVIAVDRVELRDGPKVRSIRRILKLTRDLRRREFDLVIDLHGLKETNILAWLTGADHRLLGDRGNRSYHSLGNFEPPPPAEDRSMHLSRTYMQVLTPLGLEVEPVPVVISPREDEIEYVRQHFLKETPRPLVGFFPGAGNASRQWPLAGFGGLAARLKSDGYTPAVFLGPEEKEMREAVGSTFPPGALILDGLSIPQFMAAASEVDIFVTNDTGPMHLAALAGAPILLVIDSRAPLTYLPLTAQIAIVNTAHIDAISVDDVHSAAQKLLGPATE
jgi:ADP-heptose:LPS heptosyltransferase